MVCKPRILEQEPVKSQSKTINLNDLQLPYSQNAIISFQTFNSLKENALLCQVCSDLFVKPQNVKDCLHKFC